jgi:adenylate kinase
VSKMETSKEDDTDVKLSRSRSKKTLQRRVTSSTAQDTDESSCEQLEERYQQLRSATNGTDVKLTRSPPKKTLQRRVTDSTPPDTDESSTEQLEEQYQQLRSATAKQAMLSDLPASSKNVRRPVKQEMSMSRFSTIK